MRITYTARRLGRYLFIFCSFVGGISESSVRPSVGTNHGRIERPGTCENQTYASESVGRRHTRTTTIIVETTRDIIIIIVIIDAFRCTRRRVVDGRARVRRAVFSFQGTVMTRNRLYSFVVGIVMPGRPVAVPFETDKSRRTSVIS